MTGCKPYPPLWLVAILLCVLVGGAPAVSAHAADSLHSPAVFLDGQDPQPDSAENGESDEPAAPDATSEEPEAVDEPEYYELFQLLADTLDQVERNYVKEVSRRELVEAAIRGMLSELDPYTTYIPPKQLDRFRSGVEAEFGGVGVQVTIDQGELRVISPIVGSPAYREGIMAGDVIVEIDGTSAQGISIDSAVERMQGLPGTEVTVKVRQPGAEEPREVTLTREVIRVETVMGDRRREDGSWNWLYDESQRIAYIRLTAFGRHTAGELGRVLRELSEDGLGGLVLDLRFNPGGLLSAAIEVSDMFLSGGRIVSTASRNMPTRSWDARAAGTLPDFPLAILVNRHSASASEIVAACLQDHGRAVVVGDRTWGKGSVQNVVELEAGTSALKLTTADYRRPNGMNIHRFPGASEEDDWGVRPDEGYRIELSVSEVTALMAERRRRDIIPRADEVADDAETPEPPVADRQLELAFEYVHGRLAEAAETPQPADEQPAEEPAVEPAPPDADEPAAEERPQPEAEPAEEPEGDAAEEPEGDAEHPEEP